MFHILLHIFQRFQFWGSSCFLCPVGAQTAQRKCMLSTRLCHGQLAPYWHTNSNMDESQSSAVFRQKASITEKQCMAWSLLSSYLALDHIVVDTCDRIKSGPNQSASCWTIGLMVKNRIPQVVTKDMMQEDSGIMGSPASKRQKVRWCIGTVMVAYCLCGSRSVWTAPFCPSYVATNFVYGDSANVL